MLSAAATFSSEHLRFTAIYLPVVCNAIYCRDVVAIAVKCLFTLRLVALGCGVSPEKQKQKS